MHQNFTGFDISENRKRKFFSGKIYGYSVDETMGKGKLIDDEIFGEKCEGSTHTTNIYHGLSKKCRLLCRTSDNQN
jgi:hypothetical protein